MSRHVLITGGAGCIGSDLAEVLHERGERVTVFDNLSSGRREHIENLLASPRFRFIQADMLDTAALEAALAGVDRVWHLAANPDVKFTPGDATDKDLQQNTIATYNLLNAMQKQGIRELAFSSTSAVYGICEKLPISEEQAPRPISLYGASKLACEALIGAFQNLFEMRCWIFRFANIVGSKVRSRGRTVIGDFIFRLRENPRMLKILGNGKQAKSYLLSSECVDAMVHCVEHAPGNLKYFNLGSNDYLTVTRIADMVVEALGLSLVPYEYTGTEGGWPGDVPRFLLDVSAVNALGWKPQRNSEQAVKFAIDSALAALAQEGKGNQ
jgi:UDP-glucose 4-epimerase